MESSQPSLGISQVEGKQLRGLFRLYEAYAVFTFFSLTFCCLGIKTSADKYNLIFSPCLGAVSRAGAGSCGGGGGGESLTEHPLLLLGAELAVQARRRRGGDQGGGHYAGA